MYVCVCVCMCVRVCVGEIMDQVSQALDITVQKNADPNCILMALVDVVR